MTAYAAPTHSELRTAVSRDLRDINNKSFSTAEVTDLINMGMAELNRLKPKEYKSEVTLVADTFSYDLTAENIDSIYKVEIWRPEWYYQTIPPYDGDSTLSGWEFVNHVLYLPRNLLIDIDNDGLTIWGYAYRDPLVEDEDVFDGDLDDEQVIRTYCQSTVFQRLVMSRGLFQQWQTDSNNSDVSATQLLGMAQVYANEWRSLRQRVRVIRRRG